MTALIASLLLAAQLPVDFIDSVATADYWFRKDSRGRGDEISEKAMPKRYIAFALAPDRFVLCDPSVRTSHLDRVEIVFRGRKYAAEEVSRTELPDTVCLRTASKVEGIRPLEFTTNAPKEKVEFRFEQGGIVATGGGFGTNDSVRVRADGSLVRAGRANTLLIDRERRPVWIDFGAWLDAKEGLFRPPASSAELGADAYERAAAAVEERVRAASAGILIHLDRKDQDSTGGMSRFVFRSSGDDEESRNDYDAIGVVIDGKVLVPIVLDGERISRLAKTEAVFADGTKTNLVFAGALAEWNALVFDLPEGFAGRVQGLKPSAGSPETLDRTRAWRMRLENENGKAVAFAARRLFQGRDFIRGAVFTASDGGWDRWGKDRNVQFTVDGGYGITVLRLSRRFGGDRWSRENESVSPGELAEILAGNRYNPEFAPRKEEDRNRFVWLGVETVALTDALAREKKAQSYLAEYSRPPLVTEVYAGSPAEKAGIGSGDVLLAIRRGGERERKLQAENDYSSRNWARYFEDSQTSMLFGMMGGLGTPWPNVENSINTMLTGYGAGAKITVIYAREGERREAAITLAPAPVHYRNAPKSRNRALGLSVKDMTFEVRRFFKLADDTPGVVIAKVKPGSPASVAGLKPYEVVTEVNGVGVKGAKDFAAKIKGVKSLTLGVRRLAQTRMVKIEISPEGGP